MVDDSVSLRMIAVIDIIFMVDRIVTLWLIKSLV